MKFFVDFLWISCLENGSKKVNIPIFVTLNIYEPALDEQNRTGHLLKMAYQYNVNTYQEHWAIL